MICLTLIALFVRAQENGSWLAIEIRLNTPIEPFQTRFVRLIGGYPLRKCLEYRAFFDEDEIARCS
jgi:hypothetical protein